MPQEFLHFLPVYGLVGFYRLAHDPQLWKPMWASIQAPLRKASAVAAIWVVLTWPIQKWIVQTFMHGSARLTGMKSMYSTFIGVAEEVEHNHNVIPLPSLATFSAMIFVLGQAQTIIEFVLKRQLRKFRTQAYAAAVSSRGYDSSWWINYQEEWQQPPYAEAERLFANKPLSRRLRNKIFQRFVVRFLLLPLDFIPFFSLAVSAYLQSGWYSQQLLTPFFAQKRMTPQQVHVFLTERLIQIRPFGFTCALLERVPLAGIVFSISNRVGAAMLAHDLEKRQHKFAAGEIKRLSPNETPQLNIKAIHGLLRPSSSNEKLPFTPPADEGLHVPGGMFSEKPGMASGTVPPVIPNAEGLKHRPVPVVPGQAPIPNEPPPAYTEHDVAEAIGSD